MSITAKAAAIACGALVLLLAGQTWRLHSAQLETAQARTDLATHTAQAERAARQQTEAYRALETQHRARITEIDTDTTAALAMARTDAARAAGTAERLRGDLASYLTQHRARAQAAAAAGQCPSDPAPLDLFADLQRRADERAGELAEVADDARARGAGCERSYDALIN